MSIKIVQYSLSFYVLYSIINLYHPAIYWFSYYVLEDVSFAESIPRMSLDEVEQIYIFLRNIAIIFQISVVLGIIFALKGMLKKYQIKKGRKEGQTVEQYFGGSHYYFRHLQEKSFYVVYLEDELTHEKMKKYSKKKARKLNEKNFNK